MTIRVDISRLPEDVAEALASGNTVEFERDGELVAEARPEPRPSSDLWEALARLPALDPGLERDIQETLTAVLRPQPYAWER